MKSHPVKKKGTGPPKKQSGSTKKTSSTSSRSVRPAQKAPLPSKRKIQTMSREQTAAKKPPHSRYKESDLGVPQLNGIRPIGVQKPPNRKRGKIFVDDGAGMRTILALVMAEKDGDIEAKTMRARQLEAVREAKREKEENETQRKEPRLEKKKRSIKNAA